MEEQAKSLVLLYTMYIFVKRSANRVYIDTIILEVRAPETYAVKEIVAEICTESLRISTCCMYRYFD